MSDAIILLLLFAVIFVAAVLAIHLHGQAKIVRRRKEWHRAADRHHRRRKDRS